MSPLKNSNYRTWRKFLVLLGNTIFVGLSGGGDFLGKFYKKNDITKIELRPAQ
jgi:hypothetical protein